MKKNERQEGCSIRPADDFIGIEFEKGAGEGSSDAVCVGNLSASKRMEKSSSTVCMWTRR